MLLVSYLDELFYEYLGILDFLLSFESLFLQHLLGVYIKGVLYRYSTTSNQVLRHDFSLFQSQVQQADKTNLYLLG
jgi:hypothetical protein